MFPSLNPSPARLASGSRGGDPVLSATGLLKSYGDRMVLDGLDLTVLDGEIFGILGPNGAGKTTAVEILQGLRARDAGTVQVLGVDPTAEPDRVHRLVGCQLQASALPERMRVGEALRLFARLAGDRVDWHALMTDWDLTPLARAPFRTLSGGERQRLFLALALVNRPRLVFLDELTQGLDPAARRATWRLVERVRDAGTTVVLVSHYMDEVERLCDRVGVLTGGRLEHVGPPGDLLAFGGPVRIRFSAAGLTRPSFAALPGVCAVDSDGHHYTVAGTGSAAVHVAARLADLGHWPSDFHVDRPSLEDVFVSLTNPEEQ